MEINIQITLKLHLHGPLLAARIDILPFFFLKSRRSLTRRKIHARFCLREMMGHRLEIYYLFCNTAFLSLFTIKLVRYVFIRQNTL